MNIKFNNIIKKLITLWALSEALLGGLLHALRIPLTGLVIGGAAAIIIIQLAKLGTSPKDILKATLIVMLVKMMLSPYTPVNAYFAVFIQGLLGSLIFTSKRFFKMRSLVFAVIILTVSALQRIFVLTIIYGKNLWEAIDLFTGIVLKQFGLVTSVAEVPSISLYIITTYLVFHVIFGFFLGWWGADLFDRIKNYQMPLDSINNHFSEKSYRKKKRSWWKKPGVLLIIFVSLFLYFYSFYDPDLSEEIAAIPVTLIIRSIAILLLWFYWLGPVLRKLTKYLLSKKETEFSHEVQETIEQIPKMKNIAYQCWTFTSGQSTPLRIWDFIHRFPANILLNPIRGNIG